MVIRAAKKYDVAMVVVSHLTDLEDGKWITNRNIRGNKTQTQSSRMALMFQDSGIPASIKEKYDIYGEEVVLECSKASYGEKGIVVLRPELHRGRFEEVVANATGGN